MQDLRQAINKTCGFRHSVVYFVEIPTCLW